MGKVNAVITARMGSSRLPGKTLMPILGKPIIGLLIERLKLSNRIDSIIMATTIKREDDPIEKLCGEMDIKCFRGSSKDVLSRVYDAAKKFETEVIVEVTGDCPLLDPWLIDECIDIFLKSDIDYLSNFIEQSYPPGVDVQIFTFKALADSNAMAKEARFREHITLYMLSHPEKYRLRNIKAPKEMHYPNWHLELDEMKDYELIKRIYENLYPKDNRFTTMDVINLLKDNPDWLLLNSDVKRVWEKVRSEELH